VLPKLSSLPLLGLPSAAVAVLKATMGVFAFIAKEAGGSWSAKAYSKEDGYDESLTAEGATTQELERALSEQQWYQQ
jgi:hypothetical protein